MGLMYAHVSDVPGTSLAIKSMPTKMAVLCCEKRQ